MNLALLFTFGFGVFAFTMLGSVAYYSAKKQEAKNESIHFTNWGN